jgi:hypothetical protein
MNGRLYDPKLHRFLQPDNFVQDPSDTQNYNRYGYCYNNPLKYADPSGDKGIKLLFDALIIIAYVVAGVFVIYGAVAIPLLVSTYLGTVGAVAAFAIYSYAAYKIIDFVDTSIGDLNDKLFPPYDENGAKNNYGTIDKNVFFDAIDKSTIIIKSKIKNENNHYEFLKLLN